MRKIILASLLLLSAACSRQRLDDNEYSIARTQVPPEAPYRTVAYVQPPVVVPQAVRSEAPLLKPQSKPQVAPTLPPAKRNSRKY